MKNIIGQIITLLLVFNTAHAPDLLGGQWKDITDGISDTDLRSIESDEKNKDMVYVGTRRALYVSSDRGQNWRQALIIKGENKSVNMIAARGNEVFAATEAGLFYSKDWANTWSRIFSRIGDFEKDALCLILDWSNPKHIMIGTANGAFESVSAGRGWRRIASMRNCAVLCFAQSPKRPEVFYAATTMGLFKSGDNCKTWERVYATTEKEPAGEEEANGIAVSSHLKYVSAGLDAVYLGTTLGLYESRDAGRTWQPFTVIGLTKRQADYVQLGADSKIYLSNSKGVFEYLKTYNAWINLFQGMDSAGVRAICLKGNELYAVSKDKVYFFDTLNNQESSVICGASQKDMPAMPTIGEAQDMAVSYAEVNPDKIIKWRKQAAKKAMFPTVSLGFDYDKDSGGYVTAGDYWYNGARRGIDTTDNWSSGRGMSWDIRLSWDLGNLIWNNDQTSIDNRSKLMVQLRDDILDELRRAYFERKRLLFDSQAIPAQDEKLKIERQLRIEELTAVLDGLTGGSFSKRCEEIKCQNNLKTH